MIVEQLFNLVKSALWQTPADASLFSPQTDWQALYKLARKQTVSGIAYDAMLTLPANLQPPRPLLLQWSNALMMCEDNNHLLNTRIETLFGHYEAVGIKPILLKGQGVAQCYPHPEHRQPGDIDVYVGKEDYERANQLLIVLGGEVEQESIKHSHGHWEGVTVENHQLLTAFASPRANRFLRREILPLLPGQRTVAIEGNDTPVLPLEVDVFFVLVHLALHFLSGGIGLRQLCDWTCLLHASADRLDKAEVVRLLQGVGLLQAAKAVGAIVTKHLGLPPEELPFCLDETDGQRGEWLLEDILQGGNFGFHGSFRRNRPNGRISGRWYTFTQTVKRCRQYYTLAPAEACWHPLKLIKTFVSIRFNRWFS